MSKNPIINALTASGYIVLIVSIINFISSKFKGKPDTASAPVVMLSLLTLSVAMMAFLFFYQPFQLFISGKKKEATSLFVQTLLAFAIITTGILILFLSGIVR